MSHDFLFKFILTGDSNVGKTAILKRFTDKKYHHKIEATVGVDFKTKTVTIEDKEIMIMSW
jgi:GTPase SAR1 family protein